MVLPAYLLTAGLGSKLWRWLVPPIMKSQITRFALGANMGLPSGGVQRASAAADRPASARAIPSRWSIAPRTSPVKPMPRSARNARRGKRWQLQSFERVMGAPFILIGVEPQRTQRTRRKTKAYGGD